MKAIWFSRHIPTESQILDARNMGFEIENLEEGMRLASINIQDLGDLEKVVSNLLSLIEKESIDAIFGVFPAPIQELIANSAVELAEGNNPPQTVYAIRHGIYNVLKKAKSLLLNIFNGVLWEDSVQIQKYGLESGDF